MRTKRMMTAMAMFGVLGLAACGGEEADDADMIMQDTIMERDVETVEMPVETMDTSVVRTEVDVDTTVDVDTMDMDM